MSVDSSLFHFFKCMRDANILYCKYYFTLSFFFLGDLVQLNYHYFGRKFMVYVFIGCFFGIWAAFAFSSQTAFQHVPLLQLRWHPREIHFALLARIRPFNVFVYNKSCENSLVCLQPSQHGIDSLNYKFPRKVLYD